MRVLHCPLMVAGNPQGLARAERALGLDSWAVAFRNNAGAYQCDEILWGEGESVLQFERKRWHLLVRALRDFDLLHFNFGMSILPHWTPLEAPAFGSAPRPVRGAYQLYARLFELRDLPLLKRAGKGIVVTYQGGDARQADYCKEHFAINPMAEADPREFPPELDAHKRWKISVFDRFADRIFSLNPDLLHVLPDRTRFLPYAHIDLTDWAFIGPHTDPEIPVVVHAPSHKAIKGTRFVSEAVARLRSEGISFEYIQIEGMTQAEARRHYERADVLIDQLLVGWYGGLAVELMALGKPVICYLRDGDLAFLPAEMQAELPIIRAEPDSVFRVLRDYLTVRKHELASIGRSSRAYVERWHDPRKIAQRLAAEYEDILATKPASTAFRRQTPV